MKLLHAFTLSLPVLLVACVPAAQREPQPSATPAASIAPPASPAPSPVATHASWMDVPATPGDWQLKVEGGETLAVFGDAQAGARATLACDRAARRITLSRAGVSGTPAQITIRTETLTRTLAASVESAAMAMTKVTLAGSDPILDAMALSKGRFAIESPSLSTLYLPSWGEVTRVVEDCR